MATQIEALLKVDGLKKDWATPCDLIHYREGLPLGPTLTLDVAASHGNAKAPAYFTAEDDGLNQSWGGHTVWLNPPYGREISGWLMKAVEQKDYTDGVWVLVPARTDTKWFHEWVLPHAEAVYFIKGRLNFDGNTQVKNKNAPFPSMLILYSKTQYEDDGPVLGSLEPTPKERGF